jgi:hypothetical protein
VCVILRDGGVEFVVLTGMIDIVYTMSIIHSSVCFDFSHVSYAEVRFKHTHTLGLFVRIFYSSRLEQCLTEWVGHYSQRFYIYDLDGRECKLSSCGCSI